ncbi:unnamed protein product [Rhodiola kirilowii]
MYESSTHGEAYSNDSFIAGVNNFIETVVAKGFLASDNTIRCPCTKCKNRRFINLRMMEAHLYKYGFTPNYFNWTLHGEDLVEMEYVNSYPIMPQPITVDPVLDSDAEHSTHDHEAFTDNVHEYASDVDIPESSDFCEHQTENFEANRFFNILNSCSDPAYEGCTTDTELSINMKMLATKANYGLSEGAFNAVCDTMKNLIGGENNIPSSFKQAKKLVADLGMGYQRIDVCVGGCMIYYGCDESMIVCRFCSKPRYHRPRREESSSSYQRQAICQMFYLPIIPRLQRLYLSQTLAAEMCWHATPRADVDRMVHPSDGESWKHLDRCHPDFAADARNVRLGLCTDGFNPWGMSSKQYSVWPVMVTPYNLPPWLCMNTRFIWLTILIPGPSNPKKRLDIYLRPLIDDLVHLWNVGVDTYDANRKQSFTLRAALMWTVSDYPAYAMLSGWSTQGKLGCPYCMEDRKTFVLKNGKKVSYFGCHRRFLSANHPYRVNARNFYRDRIDLDGPVHFRSAFEVYGRVENLKYIWEQHINEVLDGFGVDHNWTKKSIFWQLPYWVDVKLRHNLDVMHVEKNVFENLFNTIMDVKGKTKDDGVKCRKDIGLYCRRPELELKMYRGRLVAKKGKYQLTREQQNHVLMWLKSLKFPDGFSSNLGNKVDLGALKLVGYKSHDAHVFLERLMPIAFKGFLPNQIWEAVSELCTFFRDICASALQTERMEHWQSNIAITLCKLETIFPPSFFDSMEHLPIHLADEVLLGGPVHYRWMYPFERFIYRLKQLGQKGNRAEVEASIVNAYIQLETSYLGSDYLDPGLITTGVHLQRNEVATSDFEDPHISIYNYPGVGGRIIKRRVLDSMEFKKATHYTFSNTPELEQYLAFYETDLRQRHPRFTDAQIYNGILNGFPEWLCSHIWELGETLALPQWIHYLSAGFQSDVACSATYKVNNYKFHIESNGEGRNTVNSHVYVKGTEGTHYYGVIEEIIHMRCRTNHRLKVVLFKCRWYDPGFVRSYPSNGVVIVNTQRPYRSYDPYILAQQAVQVYYVTFPGLAGQNNQGWVAICPVKPTNAIDMEVANVPFQDEGEMGSEMPVLVNVDESLANLADDEVYEYDTEEDVNNEHVADNPDTDEESDESS